MRATLLSPLLAVALAGPAWADPPAVRLPALPSAPVTPHPTPAPDAATRLAPDLLYVFDADAPALVLVSPAGRAKVTAADGPVRVRGRFADDPGKVQTREFKGKVVYEVESVADGPCELLVVPAGATDPAAVLRRQLLCVTGLAPQPPPVTPPVTPDPGQPAGGLYFVVVRPAGPASPAFTAAMGLPEWATLRAAGHRVKDFDPARAVELLGAGVVPAGTQLPVVVTLREQPGGSTVVRGPVPLPATGAAVLDLPRGVR